MKITTTHFILLAFTIGTGLALSGWFIGHGFVEARTGDRYVTVKGVSERDVMADIAIWPIRFVAAGNDLESVQQKITQDRQRIQEFLASHGLSDEAVEIQNFEVTDRTAEAYQSGPYENRFILAQTLMVRSDKVRTVNTASQDIGTLVASGIILNNQYTVSGPTYLFNGISKLKPEMIAEATTNARNSA